jgi:periplasmic protein TonB
MPQSDLIASSGRRLLGETTSERVESEYGVRVPGSPDTLALTLGATALPNDARQEPVLASPAPRGKFPEVMRLDPARIDLDLKPPPVRRSWPRGAVESLILHLLPLLLIIGWPARTPVDTPAPIPVELVIEQPPPPPPAEPKPAKPLQGRRASDDFAEVASPKPDKGAADAPRSAGEPQPPAAETPSAASPPLVPPPEPAPPKEPTSADPQPTAAETLIAGVVPPLPLKPTPAKPAAPQTPAALRTPKPLGSEWPLPLYQDHPQIAARPAKLIGPSAVRDEYCARLLSLTLRNIGLLPLSTIGERRGETTVTFRLTGDGTLNSVKVARSSGYPDIDERVAQMVLAVGRFPPLPPYIPGHSMDFTFDLHFPHPLQR